MKGKSNGLPKRIGCVRVHRAEAHCLAGDRMIIFCRKPPSRWRTSKQRTGADQLFEGIVRKNVIAKLEVGYTSTRK